MKQIIFTAICLLISLSVFSQTGTEFWFAAPEVTSGHGAGGGTPIYIRVTTMSEPVDITVSIPANVGFIPLEATVPAFSYYSFDLTAYIESVETKPANAILNTGLLIESTGLITCYYEVGTFNNPELFSLKGPNGLGKEFYIPHHNMWNNGVYTPTPYTSFDIVATENNTTVRILPKTNLVGRTANVSFQITLNKGQTYSAANATSLGINHPVGSIVTSDKPIAITVKGDSEQNSTCRDLTGDQIVPVNALGYEYIVVRGGLKIDHAAADNDHVFIVATENNTDVYIDGVYQTTLFNSEFYAHEIPITTTYVYVESNKPVYCYHVSGYGCEMGSALLPSLNCAGSERIAFVRTTSETFTLNVLVLSDYVSYFNIDGPGTATLVAGDFQVVPGTGGVWSAARKTFTTAQITVNEAYMISNDSVIFSMGIINGGATNGCNYGYFSEFISDIKADAGSNIIICAGQEAELSGSVSGGATTGIWTTAGGGSFDPSQTSLNARYIPSFGDIMNGSVKLYLTSTGICYPVTDSLIITINPGPTANAGANISVCANNPIVQLDGSVTLALGGLWSGGLGVFSSTTALNATYTPTADEIAAGTVELSLTTTGNGSCDPATDNVLITFTPAPTANAGATQTVCANNSTVNLNGIVTVATGGLWSGGTGSFSSTTALSTIYTPSPADIAAGNAILTLTTTGNGNCNAVSSEIVINISPKPIVDAGAAQVLCSNKSAVSLNGSVLIAGGGLWSGGMGIFDIDNADLNATYYPTAGEIATGFVNLILTSTDNGICNAETDNVVINFTESPTVDAGPNQTVCSNNPAVTLNGSVSVATGGLWSGGMGSYSTFNTDLNAVYTPTQDEINAGTLTLTLTSTGNGNCNPVSDNIVITFSPSPTANAGSPQTLCANNAVANLNGIVTVASGGEWVGGNGSFFPGRDALSCTYTPTAAEIASGSVILTLVTTGNGNCNAVSHNITITYTNAPIVDAGLAQVLCSNNNVASLNGSISNAGGGVWSGGMGIFSSTTDLNATYTPTAGELANGFVNIVLTSTGNGNCLAVSDNIVVSYSSSPTANAGPNQSVCSNNPAVVLNGSVSIAGGGVWTGGNGSFSGGVNNLNATYTPTIDEINAGSLTLTLTTIDNGTCNSVSDEMTITFTASPTANAGLDQTLCANNASVILNGSVSVASGGEWVGGNGSFSPGRDALGCTYTPSAGEIIAGSVSLTLITTGNGNCNAVSDVITINFTEAPVVNAGLDQFKCLNNNVSTLNGSVTNAGGGVWSGGMGIFSSTTNLNATYTPTAGELANGFVNIILTSTGNGNCLAVTDNMVITFTEAPTSNAGVDQTVCANNATVNLNGAISLAGGSIWTGGSGDYSPSNTVLNPTYTPSSTEISNGTVTLVLTTTDNGTCNPVSDAMIITITPAPIVSAGSNLMACKNNPMVTLAGSVIGAGGGAWSGGGGTFNPSNLALNASYTPTPAELAAGSVTLTLQSTLNGNCNPVSSQMTITYTDAPIVAAGSNQTKCANNAITTLAGSVIGAGGGQWSGGLGFFHPNSQDLNAVYTPTAGEIASGSITLTLSSTGNGTCNPETSSMTIFFTPSPTVNAGIDQAVCANNSQVSLNGVVGIATGGSWSGGGGTYSPSNTELITTYTPSAAEIAAGNVSLVLTTTGNGNCIAVNDVMNISISPAPIVNAGSNLVACENNSTVSLAGSVQNAGGGIWSGGNGVFNPSNTALNATYAPTADEINSGSISLVLTSTFNNNCFSVSNSMNISVTPAPVVNAGPDLVRCSNNANANLIGSVVGATGGQWSGGLGQFLPNPNSLNVTYIPTAGEIASGGITLTLTSTGHGSCNPVTDNVNIAYTAAPTVDAGSDQVVCANNNTINLNGAYTISSGAIWSGGNGSYSPNNTSMNAVYTPSTAEIAAGQVTLSLTTTGNGNCVAVSDNVTFYISPAPIVNAGLDITACKNNSNINLNGMISNAGGGIWTGGSGSFILSNTTLNAQYIPTQAEIDAGMLLLTLESTGNGSCLPVSDDVLIRFNPSPVANAGADQTVCANNNVVTLNGQVSNAGGGLWSGGLGLFTPNNSILNATYTPTQTELNNGMVTLTLTTTQNGSCLPESDNVTIYYTPAPVVDAGIDFSLCNNNATAQLSGSISVASGGEWTGGSGSFIPNRFALDAQYIPTQTELSSGVINLTLTSTGNGNCIAVSDNLQINVIPAPIVSAGIDQSVCIDNPAVSLTGYVGGTTTTGIWSTTGDGSFVPNASSLNTTYNPGAGDKTNGSVLLILSSTNNGLCNAVRDTLEVLILPEGFANAGSDVTVCANNAAVFLNGSVWGGAATGKWSTTGSGVFIPNNTSLNATYIPSVNDTAVKNIKLILTANSCNNAKDTLDLTITPAPKVIAGNNITVCVDNLNVQLNGQVFGGTTTGIWVSSGTGSFSPSNSALNAVYHASSQDSINQHIKLTLISTNNGNCSTVSDSLNLYILPEGLVDAGFDQTFCANNADIQLNGQVSGGASQGLWSSSGTGTFSPNATTLNAKYIPSAADTATGSVTLALFATDACNFAVDVLQVNFNPAPYVDAGPNQSICSNNAVVNLNGFVSVATGGIWSGGNGTFDPNPTNLNAVYTPTLAEIQSGSLTLTLTSTGNGNCSPETDNMTITFTPSPTVNAGNNQTICANNPLVSLNGLVSVAGGGTWTGGNGVFTPDNNSLVCTYLPTEDEINSGSITLTLSSTDNGNCLPVSHSITINFSPAPVVNSGIDQTLCANKATVYLDGSVTVASGALWSGGSGQFLPNNNILNARYIPTSTEINNGIVRLYLTSTGNGNCIAVVDSIDIDFTPAPIVNAGLDQTLCANNSLVSLTGSVTIAGGLQWSGGTGTFAPSTSDLNVTYSPSALDISNGGVNIILTSTDNGNCNPVKDTARITLTPAPVAFAGVNQYVCASAGNTTLNGSVYGGASQGLWSTLGDGTFTPDNTSLNAQYNFGVADLAAGFTKIVLTTTDNGDCIAVTDTMTINLGNSVFVYAGPDKRICSTMPEFSLEGFITGGSTFGAWTSSGSGSFSPSNQALNAIYTLTADDYDAGEIEFYLVSIDNGGCDPGYDTVKIFIDEPSFVDVGSDKNICSTSGIVQLNANISGTATTGVWGTTGDGTFIPGTDNLNPQYVLGANDLLGREIKMFFRTNNHGGCNTARDTLNMKIWLPNVVDAGSDLIICSITDVVNINGDVSGGTTTGIWTSSGSGSFDNNTLLNTNYNISSADSLSGSFALTLTSSGNLGCPAVNNSINVNLHYPTFISISNNVNLCNSDNAAQLNVALSGTATEGIWTSAGDGTFSPDNLTLSPEYILGINDLINNEVKIYFTTTNHGVCAEVKDSVMINIWQPNIVNAGSDINICSVTELIALSGSVSGGTTTGMWSTTGNGFFDNNSLLNTNYNISYEDSLAGEIILYLNSTGNLGCGSKMDSLIVLMDYPTIINFGGNHSLCSSDMLADLNVSLSGTATAGLWSTAGDGVFNPDNESLNVDYILGVNDLLSSHIKVYFTTTNHGLCPEVKDSINIVIWQPDLVNAGADISACSIADSIVLNGSVSGGTITGLWTTSGTGYFNNDNLLNASYFLSSDDSLAGEITLYLTSTGNSGCQAKTDSLVISLDYPTFVDLGSDFGLCSSENLVPLTVNISGMATSGVWTSSGNGSFIPDNESLIVEYELGLTDISEGFVSIYFSSTNHGLCPEAKDSLIISIWESDLVVAGADISICSTVDSVMLAGSVSGGTTTGLWTTSGTGYFTNDTLLNTHYYLSSLDSTLGEIIIYLISTGNLGCNPVVDSLIISIDYPTIIYVGNDINICNTDNSILLNASMQGTATNGYWLSSGTGIFVPDSLGLTTEYILSINDLEQSQFTISYTSINHGQCNIASDSLMVNIWQPNVVSAGSDVNLCANQDSIILNGTVSGGGLGIIWSSTGTGQFTPDNNIISPIYLFSSLDSITGFVDLILTSTGNLGCSNVSDTLRVNLHNPPIVNPGNSFSVCFGIDSLPVSGTVVNAPEAIWSSSGTGSFALNAAGLQGYYYPSASDFIDGSVVLSLSSVGALYCENTINSITVSFTTPLTPNFSWTTPCVGSTVTFTDLTQIHAGTITGWRWTFNGINPDLNTNPQYTFITDGMHNVNLVVNSSLGCSYSISQNVFVNPIPNVAFTYDTKCYLDAIDFNDISTVASGAIVGWEWDFGLGNNSNLQNPSFTFDTSGVYPVALVVVSDSSCYSSNTLNVEVLQKPQANFDYLYNCATYEVAFNDISVTNGNTISDWNWSFDNGLGSNQQNPTNQYADTGSYNVQFIVYASENCNDTLIQTIRIYDIKADFDFVNACLYDSVKFIDASELYGISSVVRTWNFGDGSTSSAQNPGHKYLLSNNYNVSLVIQTPEGCIDSVSKLISVYPIPIAGFNIVANDLIIKEQLSFVNTSSGANSYMWYFGDNIGYSTNHSPSYIYTYPGNFIVKQVVYNEFGCADSTVQALVILDTDDAFAPALPTAFTPNNDGLNDIYRVRGGPFTEVNFKIYNEWGQLLFESFNADVGWDGTFKGKEQPVGVYIYTISAVTIEGKDYKASGEFTLIR